MLNREQALRFRALSAERQRKLIEGMSPAELLELDADFELYAHDDQLPPEAEGWRVWLMMAGRGFGKTRSGAEWVNKLARKRGLRIALVAASIDEARGVMVEGSSGVLAVARRHRLPVKWEPSLKQLKWPSGTVAHLYSGDHADGLRGPEHAVAWCDELAKWRQAERSLDQFADGPAHRVEAEGAGDDDAAPVAAARAAEEGALDSDDGRQDQGQCHFA